MVQYFFYKNVACFTNQLYYAFYSNFSSQTLFDGSNLAAYNILYTALPIFLFSIMARNIKIQNLLSYPHFYKRVARNKLLSTKELLSWFLQGVWHSFAVYYGWILYWDYMANAAFQPNDKMSQKCFGLCVYTTLLIVVSVKLLFQSRSISWLLLLSIIISLLLFSGINVICHTATISTSFMNILGGNYNTSLTASVPLTEEMFMVSMVVFSNVSVWIHLILLVIVSLIPDVLIRIVRKHWSVIVSKMRVKQKILDININDDYQRERYQVPNRPSIIIPIQ